MVSESDVSSTTPRSDGNLGDSVLRAVKSGNIFEETLERLLQAIKLGVVAHGDRMPSQRDLAERLNVSRVTLRQAIRALEQAGFVESRRGRHGGTFVTYRPDSTNQHAVLKTLDDVEALEDCLRLRRVLETGVADLAARRTLTAHQRETLRARLDASMECTEVQYRQCDSLLHLAIADIAGSRSLVASIADMRMRLNAFLDGIPLIEVNIENSHEQHGEIVASILAGDAEGARSAMTSHVEATEILLRGFLT